MPKGVTTSEREVNVKIYTNIKIWKLASENFFQGQLMYINRRQTNKRNSPNVKPWEKPLK